MVYTSWSYFYLESLRSISADCKKKNKNPIYKFNFLYSFFNIGVTQRPELMKHEEKAENQRKAHTLKGEGKMRTKAGTRTKSATLNWIPVWGTKSRQMAVDVSHFTHGLLLPLGKLETQVYKKTALLLRNRVRVAQLRPSVLFHFRLK